MENQQVFGDGFVVGHMRDAGERQERMLPTGGHQRLAESQAVCDGHVVIGESVDEHERTFEIRRVRDDAIALVYGRVEAQVPFGVVRVVKRPVSRRSARAGSGEHIRRLQHGERGEESAI